MTDIAQCPLCEREYESHMIQEMRTSDGAYYVCPICALKIRNEMHGLPENTPFSGKKAQAAWHDAMAYLHQTGQAQS